MYQRLAMAVPNTSNPQHERHEKPNQLIGDEKEDAGETRHDEHHQGGDHGLAPRRPRDLLGLGADLLQELERTDLRHALTLSLGRVLGRPPGTPGRPANLAVYIR